VLAEFVDSFAGVRTVLTLFDGDHAQGRVRELVGSCEVRDSDKKKHQNLNKDS